MEELIVKYSTWPKLVKIVALCLRFIRRFIERYKRDFKNPTSNLYTLTEIRESRQFLIRAIQKKHYSIEIQDLRKGHQIKISSPIKSLNPFLDQEGILRVSGRLNNAPMEYDAQHPIILPKHQVSTLLATQAHVRCLHGGPQLTLFVLRQIFWIVNGRGTVKKIIHGCISCVRQKAKTSTQLMADLPTARVTVSKPFTHCGLDYAGPIAMKLGKGRGYQSQKGYIVLFVCLATRAIHLELVSDNTTIGFLAALKRFVARRGLPSNLYSDNGKNFEGADKELQRSFKKLSRDPTLQGYFFENEIVWHFIPPYAPHFGGLWEAGVKCVKHHFRRIVGTLTFTFEELNTILCEIEACLNSRPLAPFTDNQDDLSYLTPGHLLIGRPLLTVPAPTVLSLNENRLTRWQLVQ